MSTSIKIQNFQDIQYIGTGSYWTLYRATQSQSGTRHLLQVLDESAAGDANLVQLYKNLRNATDVLHHDNILTPIDFEQTANYTFLLYDDFDGHTLNDDVENSSPLREKEASDIIRHLAEALQYAQIRGVRHGWVSPELVLRSAKDNQVKLFGFGSEKILAYLYDKRPDIADKINPYIPPENLGQPEQPIPDDCYALGVLFYQLLTGRRPFTAENVAALKQAKLSPLERPEELTQQSGTRIANLIGSLLDPKPFRRATYSSLLNELDPQDNSVVPLDHPPYEKETGFTKMRDLVSEMNPLKKNNVGSTKRIAYTVAITVIALVILFGIVVVSRLSTNEEKHLEQIYNEYLAEQEYEQMNESSTYTREKESEVPSVVDEHVEKIERNDLPSGTFENRSQQDQATEADAVVESKEERASPSPVSQKTSLLINVTAKSEKITAEIFVDGQRRGYSATDGTCVIDDLLVNKSYRLRVVRDGYHTWEKIVNIQDGENSLNVNLLPDVVDVPSFTFEKVSFADQIKINDESVARNLPCTIKAPVGQIRVTYIDSRAEFSWRTSFYLTENQKPISVSAEQVGQGELVVVLSDPIQYGYAFVKIDDQNEQHTTPFRTSLVVGWHRVRVFRDDYTISPADTTVFIRPGVKLNVRCDVH